MYCKNILVVPAAIYNFIFHKLFKQTTSRATLISFLLSFSFLLQSTHASDLSTSMAESQIQRKNPVTTWRYYDGFFMYSLFKVYQRTKNPQYLEFIKKF